MGVNQFLTLATLNVGSEGPQTAIDLLSLSNPSGLDSNLTFICTGKFIGDISIEGSPSSSGDDWDVITQFNSGISPDSNPLQSPASQDVITVNNVVVRRIRANVRGRVLSTTTLSVAGQQNCDCQPSGSPDWPLDIGRYFFIDPVLGDDANIGYIDAALGSTFTSAQVTAVAKATYAGFRAILPPSGNNRTAILLMLAGAYADLDFRGVSGYKYLLRRGSDGTNSTADRLTCGFVTALAGPNGDGSFTVAAASTVDLINISSGTFTAEPGILGYRIRFTGNVTAALANIARPIYSNTGSSLVPEASTGTAPAVGDTFFIERPGVVATGYYPPDGNPGFVPPNTTVVLNGWPVVGVRVDSTTLRSFVVGMTGSFAAETMVGIEQTGNASGNNTVFSARFTGGISIGSSYVDETGTSRVCGMTMRCADSFPTSGLTRTSISSIYDLNTRTGTSTTFSSPELLLCTTSGYFASGLTVGQLGGSALLGASSGSTANQSSRRTFGPANTSTRPVRCPSGKTNSNQTGVIQINGNLAISAVVLTNAGANPCIAVIGSGIDLRLDTVTGSSGNTDVGVDLLLANKASVQYITGNTLTGTAGDIRLVGPAITTIAGLAQTNVVDSLRNNIQGTAGQVVDVCTLVQNGSGGVLAVGALVRNNGTTGQVTSALATQATPANANVSGVMVTPPAHDTNGYMATAATPVCNFDGAPSLAPTNGIAYLSPGTTGTLTTTIPAVAANAQKLRVGRIISISGTTARVAFHPENLAVLADGLA